MQQHEAEYEDCQWIWQDGSSNLNKRSQQKQFLQRRRSNYQRLIGLCGSYGNHHLDLLLQGA